MDDFLIVGGGVIGLSLAWECRRQGGRVRVLERGEPGRESSWAGAGIVPPSAPPGAPTALVELAELSHRLHQDWAAELQRLTGIDNGWRRSGALYLAQSTAERAELRELRAAWHVRSIPCEHLSPAELALCEPQLSTAVDREALEVPSEGQIRNPRHVQALLRACREHGVEVEAGVEVRGFEIQSGTIQNVATSGGPRAAGMICVCGGAWSGALCAQMGCPLPIRPLKGQIALLSTPPATIRRVINLGKRYLVPRDDGRVLVGSTEEEAGFDRRTTSREIGGLLAFAAQLVPALASAPLETSWAGLRPATADALPFLGRVPGLDNGFVAAGHFRAGLHLSPGTAVVMAALLRGETPPIDLHAFRVERALAPKPG